MGGHYQPVVDLVFQHRVEADVVVLKVVREARQGVVINKDSLYPFSDQSSCHLGGTLESYNQNMSFVLLQNFSV